MAPRNPSELERLEEERQGIKESLRTNLYRDKASKQKLLDELHSIERTLGVELSSYNPSSF